MRTVSPASSLRATLDVPGDKSISHRALIFNAIAEGTARISNLATGQDVQDTAAIMQQLGADIQPTGQPNCCTVQGRGLQGLKNPAETLDAGNSGTGMRLISGVLAGAGLNATLTGDASLNARPMGRIMEPLRQMGAKVEGRNGNLAPLQFKGGPLKGIRYKLPVASAQVKSCIMLAALFASGSTAISQPGHSRDHSERMLETMGAQLETNGLALEIQPGPLHAADVQVVGDISSALFWIVAAVAHPNAEVTLRNVGVNPGRAAVLDVLRRMGAQVELHNPRNASGEPVADISAHSSQLKGIRIEPHEVAHIVDEVPALAVAAAAASGSTTISGAQELRHKESDRIAATCSWLKACGVDAEEHDDGFTIAGGRIRGGSGQSLGDHRIAMAMAIGGLLAEEPISIEDADAAATSYPEFWDHLEQAHGGN